ncbi:serine hydrolase [Actinorhabdospora filicis]|uniref:Serine hydrolase n=1 Tax=Actinorhabdospora filicis TaxID=1785913 RepID=A0A9W6SVD3_9ACTN|nr:serine hydrolase domain-containing protein [Actinorhabdospora filicis]GLZ81446.1 serine hydrolase [Actinorhabdospora filicis]
MTDLPALLHGHVEAGTFPGAVALVAHGDRVETAVAGSTAFGGPAMEPGTLFRVASVSKPIVTAAAMLLVEDGRLRMDAPIAEWLPELAAPVVVREPAGPVDDVVPAARPITVADVLTYRCGWGFPDDFSLPALGPLFALTPDTGGGAADNEAWLKGMAAVPLLRQPGEGWLYNTSGDLLGVLIARASGQSLPGFCAERVFAPLGMSDTGFHVAAADLGRLATAYTPAADGTLEPVTPGGEPTAPPSFPSGAGGLVSTLGDLHTWARALLTGGLLTPASVRAMTTDHLTPAQRASATLFLEGQGWGFGGSVDVVPAEPWNVPGRYGWVGGSGTTWHVIPSTGTITIMLTQRAMTGPAPTPWMRDFWRYAAS